MKKNKFARPQAYAAPTKDTRYAGTFEVLIALPDRVKPHRLAQHFKTQKAAEDWIHSPEGVDTVDDLFARHAKDSAKKS